MTPDQIFVTYLASLAGWRHHPGYKGRGIDPPSLAQLVNEALNLTWLTANQLKEPPPWLDGEQQHKSAPASSETGSAAAAKPTPTR